MRDLAASVTDTVAVVGLPALSGDLHNAAAVLADGTVAATYRKHFLPNYAVFDEQRYFARGDDALVVDLAGVRVGVTICEDLWYPGGPGQWAAIDGGAELVVNLSGSPYHRGKGIERERMLARRAADYCCFIAFCNAVGGQDELVFDGHSLVIDPTGAVLARGAQFEEDLLVVDIDAVGASRRRLHDPRWRQSMDAGDRRVRRMIVGRGARERQPLKSRGDAPVLDPNAEVYHALALGTGDYFRKNGFPPRRARALGWHRFGPRAHRRRRCPRCGRGDGSLDAVTIHGRHEPGGRERAGREPRRGAPGAGRSWT